MKIFNIGENIRKDLSGAIMLYVGILIIIFSIIKFADPATYDAKIRQERAEKEYRDAQGRKTVNSLTSSDYNNMQNAFNDIQNSHESPIGYYIVILLVGGGIAFVGFKKLNYN